MHIASYNNPPVLRAFLAQKMRDLKALDSSHLLEMLTHIVVYSCGNFVIAALVGLVEIGSSLCMLMKESGLWIFTFNGSRPSFTTWLKAERVRATFAILLRFCNATHSVLGCCISTIGARSLPLSFDGLPGALTVNGKCARVSEDGGFHKPMSQLRACY